MNRRQNEMKILVTGAKGFIGRNLVVVLKRHPDVEVVEYDLDTPRSLLEEGLARADVIFHLAGINRPEKPEDFVAGNIAFTQELCERLRILGRKPTIVFSSSIQAELDNPYGISKRRAEETLLEFSEQTGARVVIFRMKNVFGKWCRPQYNSVVATFCYNIARDLPISISDPANELTLVYIDDVCVAMEEAAGIQTSLSRHYIPTSDSPYADIAPAYKIPLGALADTIYSFRAIRSSLQLPAFDDLLIQKLYATYLSYLDESDFAYGLDIKRDSRGILAEFLKSSSFGQIFISRTKPGVTRGNHYHHTKTEKFLVVQGQAIVRFRDIRAGSGDERVAGSEQKEKIIEYVIRGDELRVVDIPPGYTHSIENIGEDELVTLFWANQIFDPGKSDTFSCEVERQ